MKQKPPEQKSLLPMFKIGLALVALSGALYMLGNVLSASNDEDNRQSNLHCTKNCTDRGFDYYYCRARCEAFTDKTKQMPEEEPRCMGDCMHSQRGEAYCKKACTF